MIIYINLFLFYFLLFICILVFVYIYFFVDHSFFQYPGNTPGHIFNFILLAIFIALYEKYLKSPFGNYGRVVWKCGVRT